MQSRTFLQGVVLPCDVEHNARIRGGRIVADGESGNMNAIGTDLKQLQ